MMLGTLTLPAVGQTLPQGGAIVGGAGSIQQPSASLLVVQQSSPSLAINWQSFNVGAGSIVRFQQPGLDSIVLNRVLGPDPSQIFGQIQANGQVVILNPNGIHFGPNSRVDVSGLVATTANVRNEDFLAGRLKFDEASANADARVVHEGLISVAQGGFTVLAAAGVRNTGRIVANGGTVVLAGTKTFTIDFHGDGLLSFAATGIVDQAPSGASALVDNAGVIEAAGGRVLLTARAARNVLDNVINTTGIVVAQSAQMVNGEIVIDGGNAGGVNVSGTLDASGKGVGETGGTVKVLGEKAALLANSRVDVSGAAGGGTALVGGNDQGQGPEPNSRIVYMDARAVIDANALDVGNGGKVVLWADDTANISGRVYARGGAFAGDGGRIETSGKNRISFGDTFAVDTLAPFGRVGSLLVDPTDFVIANTGGDMTPAVLAGLLGSSDVTIQSTTGSVGTTGTIYLNNNLSVSAGTMRTLTLNAVGGIEIAADITSNSYALNLQLNAGSNVNVSGNVQVYGGNLATNLTGGAGQATGNFASNGTIDVGSGNITLNHTGNVVFNAPVTSSGTVTVNAIGTVTQGAGGAITGSPGLSVSGIGTVALTHASNDFSTITFNRTGTYGDVNLVTTALPNVLTSTLGTGNYSLTGSGFSQTGSITQDYGASGSISINGGAGSVILSNANNFSGDLLVSGDTIHVRAPQTFNNFTAKTASFTATTLIELDGTNTNPNYYTGAIAASGAGSVSTVLTAGANVILKGSVTSNGGNITVWGNAPGGDPNAGVSVSGGIGVFIANGGIVNASGGNIDIAGRGGNNYGAWGVGINNGQVLTTGSGAVSLTGLGDTGAAASLIGVGLQASALVQTHNGNLTITGTGGNGTIGYNSGVLLLNSSINVSGNGSIQVTGTGGTNANTESVYLANASITSGGSGNIFITAPTPAGGGVGINLLSSSVEIGGASFQGNLTLAANSIASTATALTLSRQAGGGTITFKPTIDSNTIGVNGGTGSLSIAGSIVGAISGYETLQFGSASQSGDIDVGTTTFSQNLRIWTQGAASSAGLSLGSHDLVIVADAGYTQGTGPITTTGTVTFGGGGDVTATNASNAIGTLVLDKASSVANVSVVTSGLLTVGASSMGTGTLSLTGNGLSQSGAIVQDPGGGSVALDAGAGSLNLNQPNIFTGNFTASADNITVLADQTFANSGTQSASLTANNGSVVIQGGISKSNNGGLSVYVDAYETVLFDNAGILSNGGNVRIWGNAPSGSTSAGSFAGSAWGVKLDGVSAVISADSGTIDIVGKGSASGTYQHGVVLINGASIQTTTGAITIQGRGGDGSGGGAMGIFLAEGSIATQSGSVMLAGWGGASSANGHGISLGGASSILSSAGGTISLSGVGTNGGFGLTAHGSPTIDSGTGTLSIASSNGIGFSSIALRGSGGAAFNGGTGSIVANNIGNQLSGAIALAASNGDASLLTSSGTSIVVGPTSIAGVLSISLGGALTQSGSITAGSSNFTAGGAIMLLDVMNNFGSTLTLSGTTGTILGSVGSVTASSGIFSVNGQTFGSAAVERSSNSPIVTPDQRASIVNAATVAAVGLLGTLTTSTTIAPPLTELRGGIISGAPGGNPSNEEPVAQPTGSLPVASINPSAQGDTPATVLAPLVPAPANGIPQPQIFTSAVPSNATAASDVRSNPAPQASPVAIVPGLLVLNPSTLPASTVGGGVPGVSSVFPANGNQTLW